MRHTPTLITLPLLLTLSGCPGQPGPGPSSSDQTRPTAVDLPSEVRAAADLITAVDLLASVTRLAADDLEGRAPGTAGDRSWKPSGTIGGRSASAVRSASTSPSPVPPVPSMRQ